MGGDSPAAGASPTVRRVYSSTDLAWLIPTKDRPEHVRALLQGLAAQTIPCGRVVIVDGGKSIEDIVAGYRHRLPVEYFSCHPPGQVRQRNLGIRRLDHHTPLVGFLDDDLVLEPDALEEIIDLWNRVEADTAGIGFNIVNAPPYPASHLARLLMRAPPPGKVLRSGYNSRIDGLDEDIRTQWLGGGYTVWRREILERYRQPELNTRWAIGEDLRFSYPISKHHPLYVCAKARARHLPVLDQAPVGALQRYRGRKASLATFYFASLHPELSRATCLGMLVARCVAQLFLACRTLDRTSLQNSAGQAEAIVICLKSVFGSADLRAALED